jgi:putative ABC transport system permease protein
MHAILQDLRYGARQLTRSPAFTIVAALTLAIGIGANTALFSFAHAVLGRPLPQIGHPEGLVWFAPTDVRGGPRALMLSYPDFLDYRDSTRAFSLASAIGNGQFSISSGGEPARVRGALVGGDYFAMLEVRPQLGRPLTRDDDRADVTQPAVVISDHLWRERFDASPTAIGTPMTVDGKRLTIVGVAPAQFNGAEHSERIDLWIPIAYAGTILPGFEHFLTQRGTWWLTGMGRLASGVSATQASAAMATVAARLALVDSVEHGHMTARVLPVTSGLAPNDGNDIAPIAALASTVTLLVLLIACANVSNLLLGRAVARRREIAVRLSLGAARGRIVRQLLTESLLLAALASGIGFLMATWATDLLAAMIPAPIDVTPDSRVLGFTLAIAAFTGIAFGLVPAMNATRRDVTAALKDSAPGSDRSRRRLQRGFVVAQISLSLVLLVTAGMFLGGLYKASKIDMHFDATDNVLAASFDIGMQGYTAERSTVFLDQVSERVRALPGVEAVSFTNQVPLGERHIGTDVTIEGNADASTNAGVSRGVQLSHGSSLEVYESTIRPQYFRTIGIPIEKGRDFTAADRTGSEPVVIVSEDFAHEAWPNGDAIGKRLSMNGDKGPFMTVVGIAREALTMGLSERRRPIVYIPQTQHPKVTDLTLLVRRNGVAADLGVPVRKIFRELDRDLPVYDIQSLAQYRHDRGAESRMGSSLLTIFGSLAMLLATIGVYAVMAFTVTQRTREIGVRVALGAARTQIMQLFVGEGLRLASIGVVVGILLSAAVAKALSATFFGITVTDAVPFAAGAIVLAAAAVAASWIPARRATRIDPMAALRSE